MYKEDIEVAKESRLMAHSPYSNYTVGCVYGGDSAAFDLARCCCRVRIAWHIALSHCKANGCVQARACLDSCGAV